MDKKTLGIAVVLGVLLVGIIVAVLVYDAVFNTNILTVNGESYDKSDFESYLKVWQYENGDEPVDIATMMNNYSVYKLYSQYIDFYDVTLKSENEVKELTEDEKTKLLEGYNLTESEYMRVKTEIALVDQLYGSLEDYYFVSAEDYEEHKGESGDLFKTYDYRVMQIAIEDEKEEEVSGDAVSGDEISGDTISGDAVSGDAVSGDNSEQARRDAAMSKAVEALAKVKSGDKFEDVAKEYGTMRISYTANGLSVVNGTKETISAWYMQNYIGDENILDAFKTVSKGDCSRIYEEESSFTFVYIEDIRDGLEGEDDNIYRKQIANEHIQGEARVVPNRNVLKNINIEELIPALTKSGDSVTEDEHDHDHDHEEVSGEVNQTASGEALSGEIITSGDNE